VPSVVVSEPTDVVEALHNVDLATVGVSNPTGATHELQQTMARFSHGQAQTSRRAAVKSAIDRLDSTDIQLLAYRLTSFRLSGESIEVMSEIARIVPTHVLATVLDSHNELGISELLADLECVVNVIGRGEPANQKSDTATRRLMRRYATHPSGPVEVISMLYQNFDATRITIGTFLHAEAQGSSAPVAAVARTRRRVVSTTEVAGNHLTPGSEVVIEIGAADLPFGGGTHECPGRSVAEAIVRGVTYAIRDAGYICDLDSVSCDTDRRPTHLVIRPAR
jgi:hypothetical protein